MDNMVKKSAFFAGIGHLEDAVLSALAKAGAHIGPSCVSHSPFPHAEANLPDRVLIVARPYDSDEVSIEFTKVEVIDASEGDLGDAVLRGLQSVVDAYRHKRHKRHLASAVTLQSRRHAGNFVPQLSS